MQPFPAEDPIPLPAYVWLFKLLELAMLTLHFCSVHLLVGGLALATLWTIVGRRRQDAVLTNAAGAISTRLPIVIAYVVNLGVPPLLFTQVLYGRLLYTSSIIIGAFWISVIGLVIAGYSLLYVMAKRASMGRTWGWIGAIALPIFATVAMIYSSNMVVMLHPESWVEMYRTNPSGIQLSGREPTVLPRWLFMMAASFTISGVALMLFALHKGLDENTAQFMRRWGGRIAAACAVAQVGVGIWVVLAQPAAVRTGVIASVGGAIGTALWLATAGGLVALGRKASVRPVSETGRLPAWASLAAVLNVGAWVVVRDRIRDVTLLGKGYDVAERHVFINWSVVVLFLLLFVAGLVLLGWMVRLAMKAERASERYV